jgi:toxin ParE1/3/4
VKLDWTRQAIEDLVEIRRFIEYDRPKAAREIALRISRAVARLTRHPQLGRRSHLPGVRDLVVAGTSYLVPYRLRGDRVELLRVLHAKRSRAREG